jgi:hypothetical protein
VVAALSFFFIVYLLNKLDDFNKARKIRLVLDLYNQGKNTREISQEVKISFKDMVLF